MALNLSMPKQPTVPSFMDEQKLRAAQEVQGGQDPAQMPDGTLQTRQYQAQPNYEDQPTFRSNQNAQRNTGLSGAISGIVQERQRAALAAAQLEALRSVNNPQLGPAGNRVVTITGGGGNGSSAGAPFGKGRLTGPTAAYGDMLLSNYAGISEIGGYRSTEDGGEHPRGRALDVMVPIRSQYGDSVAERAIADFHNGAGNVMYVIWNGTIWSDRSPNGRPYTGDNPHIDHVHISFRE